MKICFLLVKDAVQMADYTSFHKSFWTVLFSLPDMHDI